MNVYVESSKSLLTYQLGEIGHLLDSHPMDGFDHEGVRKAFSIPDNFFIPMLVAIGHFDEKHKLMAPKWRKSFDDMVFRIY